MTNHFDVRIPSVLAFIFVWTTSGALAQAAPAVEDDVGVEAQDAETTTTPPAVPPEEPEVDAQAKALKAQGYQHFQAHRYFEAVRTYEKLIALTPRDGIAHALLGRALLAHGDRSEALRSLRTAHELLPANIAILRLLERVEHSESAPSESVAKAGMVPVASTSTHEVPVDDGESLDDEPVQSRILHGFRLGYVYQMNLEEPGTAGVQADDGDLGPSLAEEYDLQSPHQFLLGYEITGRLVGHSWLNVILVGNVSIAGLEQSRFFPMASGLIGFEFHESFQAGVGINLAATEHKPAHMIMAAGWTPKVGSLYVPVHFFFVPDVDHAHRAGITFGVNWQ